MSEDSGYRRQKPSEIRAPDIELSASARADEIVFEEVPETGVEFTGEAIAESRSGSNRENLPEKLEPGEVWRNIRIDWGAAAWVEEPDQEAQGEAGDRE